MYQSSVLLIDSDTETLNVLSRSFQGEGAQVKVFRTAMKALDFLQAHQQTDVVLTNWKLPSLDGLELCKLMKRSQELAHIPVVIISERDSEIDAVTALEVGAEDYIRKPVMAREIITRVKKILQRQEKLHAYQVAARIGTSEASALQAERKILLHDRIKVDTYRHKAYVEDQEVKLTYSEFKLLELFLTHPGRVFQRSTLIEKINGIDYYATERSVDVMIVGLRKKLGTYKQCLETVRGVGYRFIEC